MRFHLCKVIGRYLCPMSESGSVPRVLHDVHFDDVVSLCGVRDPLRV